MQALETLLASPLLLFVLAIDLLGIVSVWLVRARGGSRCPLCYCFYFAALAAVAAATVHSMATLSSGWFVSGMTFGVMVVAAVFDPGRREEVFI